MTPRSSLRALARDIYTTMNDKEYAMPTAEGACGNDARYAAPSKVAPELMAQVRALYEDSAVPVREIARRAGVTERTLYKYAERHAWRRRYTFAARYAPVKGAGGRFIAREDAGQPHASGLKALDPAGRAEAARACAEAAERARTAQAKAERERRFETFIAAGELTSRLMRDLNRMIAKRRGRAPSPLDMQAELAFLAVLNTACGNWESLIPAFEVDSLAFERSAKG